MGFYEVFVMFAFVLLFAVKSGEKKNCQPQLITPSIKSGKQRDKRRD